MPLFPGCKCNCWYNYSWMSISFLIHIFTTILTLTYLCVYVCMYVCYVCIFLWDLFLIFLSQDSSFIKFHHHDSSRDLWIFKHGFFYTYTSACVCRVILLAFLYFWMCLLHSCLFRIEMFICFYTCAYKCVYVWYMHTSWCVYLHSRQFK